MKEECLGRRLALSIKNYTALNVLSTGSTKELTSAGDTEANMQKKRLYGKQKVIP